MTGAQLAQGRVSVGLGGHIALTGAVLRAPGIEGPAGEILRVDRLDASVSWSRLLGFTSDGKPALSEIYLIHPRLRVSQNSADGTLNISALRLPDTSAQPSDALPRIQIDEGEVELGEHAGNGVSDPYTLLKHIDLHGHLSPSTSASNGSVELVLTPGARQTGTLPAPEPVRITGSVKGPDLALSVSGLSLKDWPAGTMPARIREVAEMLNLQGSIGRTTFSYSPASAGRQGDIRASAELIDVAVNLPVTDNAEVAQGPGAPLLRMTHVNGSIDLSGSGANARLVGSIEEVPYTVDLQFMGSDHDSPFRCEVRTENFRMEKDLRILRFVPPLVRERLADFSWPTGSVSSHVTLSRGAAVGGRPADLSVVGELEVKDAVSAFKRFPYEFRGLSGRVTFNDSRIDILDITGKSPAGATIRASGFIEPPTSDAYCVIDVHVSDMPIDEDVLRALTARRGGVVPVLFNRDHYTRLLAAGLLARPGDTTVDPAVPRFGLSGLAQVHTKVTRPLGADTEWLEQTSIDFQSLSILPEWFPLPMIATGVKVVIDGDSMTVRGGEYRPITGGLASATADVDYRTVIDPARDGMPEVTVKAADVPSGRLLNYAIGATLDRAARNKPGGSSGPRLRGILDDLNAVGLITGEVRLFNDDKGEGRVAANIQVAPTLLRPWPEDWTSSMDAGPAQRQLEITGATGQVKVTDRVVEFDFSGRAVSRAGAQIAGVEAPPPADAGAIRVLGRVAPDEKDEASLRASVVASGVELSAPIEQILGVFSPRAATKWSTMAQAYHPSGRAGGRIAVEPSADGSVATVRLDSFDGLRFDVDGSSTILSGVTGALVGLPDGGVRFEDFAADTDCGAGPAGRFAASGTLEPAGPDEALVAAADFKASLTRARAESGVLRALACKRLSKENAELLRSLNPRGEFDARFEVRTGEGVAGGPGLVGIVQPHSLTVRLRDTEVPFETMGGQVTFTPSGGQLRAVEGTGPDFSIRADGSWAGAESGDVDIDLTLAGKSQKLPPALRAMMPQSVDGVLRTIEFDVDGRVDLEVMQLRLTQSSEPQRQHLLAGGKIGLAGGKMTLGLPVTECDGKFDFKVENTDFSTPPAFTINSSLDGFRLGGLKMQHGRVLVEGKAGSGEVLVRDIMAECYGGRFTGDVVIGAPAVSNRAFEASFQLTDVRFAPTLRDLTTAAGQPIDEKPVDDTDATRGLIDAKLSLGGRIDSPATRRGSGSATIAGPSVMRMPLVMPLIRFSNLQIPTDEPLELARASFYIDGPVMAFEDLSVFSRNVHILGFGTMSWPEMALDLRFNSRAVKRIPIINWLIEGIRDELVTTRVTGTPGKPEVESVPFESTSRFFLQVFGSGISEKDKRMLELGKQAERGGAR